ncbi:hypothetical protein BC936DRAFT_146656 [Jimgerdemannia flammicorona]|uniref:Uncharacterized protein n=1 Tax=Jimgerdemannia flammicorona TaxID=994334 RepID=A0A433D764_9FUNG|nr:hypothetical protein BC936DRAFT_146656 [Jimgerdemannia flammicorona]
MTKLFVSMNQPPSGSIPSAGCLHGSREGSTGSRKLWARRFGKTVFPVRMGDGEEVFWLAVVTPSLHYTMRGGERTIFRSNLSIKYGRHSKNFIYPCFHAAQESTPTRKFSRSSLWWAIRPISGTPTHFNTTRLERRRRGYGRACGQFAAGVRRVWKDRWEERRAGEGRVIGC